MLLYARSYCPPTTKKAWGLQINLDITVKIFLLITISQTLFFFPCARGKTDFYRHEIAFLIFFPRSAVWYYKIKLWITLFLGLKFYFIFFLFLVFIFLQIVCQLVCERIKQHSWQLRRKQTTQTVSSLVFTFMLVDTLDSFLMFPSWHLRCHRLYKVSCIKFLRTHCIASISSYSTSSNWFVF